MFSRFFDGNKQRPEDFEKMLAQARRHLWRNELNNAQQIFNRVKAEIKIQVQKDSSTSKSLSPLHFQAQLGGWAIRYLNDPSCRMEIPNILEGKRLDSDAAYFIARVFQSREDNSVQAIQAYKDLLQFNASAKLAHRIADLVNTTAFSVEAFELLELLTQVLPDDLQITGRLCRWYLHAGSRDKANELAYRIIRNDPHNVDANLCLAVKAEQGGDWDTAAKHYRVTQDYLRLAVVLAKSNKVAEAEHALMLVAHSDRNTATWLYHRGWVAFQQHDVSSALEYWKQMRAAYPQHSVALDKTIRAAEEQLLYAHLKSFDLSADLKPEDFSDTQYQSVLALQAGASKLVINGNGSGSKPLLHEAARTRYKDLRAVTFLLLQQALEKSDEAADAVIYQQLIKNFGDGSLFLWLRGLLLLRSGQNTGHKYLRKAYQDGVCKRHLPIEAVQAVNWLGSRFNGVKGINISQSEADDLQLTTLNDSSTSENLFLWAVAPSYTVSRLENGGVITWINAHPPLPDMRDTWHRVQAAYYLEQRNWRGVLHHLSGSSATLKAKVVSTAIQDAVNKRDWISLAEYVKFGLDATPGNQMLRKLEQQLRPQMQELLWQNKELETLDFELEKQVRSGQATTAVYHAMALVYTQLAVAKDQKVADYVGDNPEIVFTMDGHRTQAEYTGILEDQAHNDYWQLAIGYWAVALSDEHYWQEWAINRIGIYGEEIPVNHINHLIKQTVPQLLRDYHIEQINAGSLFASHHRFYASIVDREIELTQAMRYLVRTAERQRFQLPDGLKHFISPLLVKEHGYESQGRDVVGQMTNLHLSPYEAELIRSAFSPLSDVKALVSIKEYEMALHALRKLMDNEKYARLQSDVRQELCYALELAAAAKLDLEEWDKAFELASEGRHLQPLNKEFRQLSVKAAIGWANSKIREEEYDDATQKLESVRSSLKQRHPDLDNLLSEAYVEWGYEAGRDEDIEAALTRFEKAVAINANNIRAKQGLNAVYYQRAISKAQSGAYRMALSDAEIALKNHEDAETLELVAKLHRAVANELDGRQQYHASDRHWIRAWECAVKKLELMDTLESLNFLVDIGMSRVWSFYSFNAYDDAIRMAEMIIQLPYDRSVFQIDLRKLLSEIYTNYGAQVFNSGNRWRGKQLMQKALEYDSTNQVARNNLYSI